MISNIRLEVNTAAARAGDQTKDEPFNPLQSYTAHYCSVPTRRDPGVVACSFILSGLRLFDIRDPYHPKEIAYSNFPAKSAQPGQPPSSYVMCAAAFVPERAHPAKLRQPAFQPPVVGRRRKQILGLVVQHGARIRAQKLDAVLSEPALHFGERVPVLFGMLILIAQPGFAPLGFVAAIAQNRIERDDAKS